MNTKSVYYTNIVLNIIAALLSLVLTIVDLAIGTKIPSRIVLLVLSSILILLFGFFIYKLRKSFFADPRWCLFTNILTSALAIIYIITSSVLYSTTKQSFLPIYIIYYAEVVISLACDTYILLKDDGKIRYNLIKRATTKTPTMTIQISNEYLVKDFYTKEESERTLKQLYSIHNSNGFSLDEYNKLREKILKNTEK